MILFPVRGFKAVSSREVRKLLAASFTRRDDRAVNSAAKKIPIWSHGYRVRFLNSAGWRRRKSKSWKIVEIFVNISQSEVYNTVS